MPIKIQLVKITPKMARDRILISPQERFNRLSKRQINRGKNYKLRRFHFNAIENGNIIVLFDGLGNNLGDFDNSVIGCRLARQFALKLFHASDNQNGGFLFTNPNFEYQTPEELEMVGLLARKNVEYHPFAICKDCKFQFQDNIEMSLHKCTENWMIFEFTRIRRVYA